MDFSSDFEDRSAVTTDQCRSGGGSWVRLRPFPADIAHQCLQGGNMTVQLRTSFGKALAMLAFLGLPACSGFARADEPTEPIAVDLQSLVDDHFYHSRPSLLSLSGFDYSSPNSVDYVSAGGLAAAVDAQFVAVRTQQPGQPLTSQPLTAPNAASASLVSGSSLAAATVDEFTSPSPQAAAAAMTPERGSQVQAGAASVVQGSQSEVRATTDGGDLLGRSTSAPGVYVQKRNPIISTPYIRGFGVGQYITQMNGAYWFPARQDLDTALSKIDSASIQDVIVIKGPFSAMYGPGFAFFDVQTKSTPRYQNGRTVEVASSYTYQSNGNAWASRQAAAGGSANYGWRIGYGIRTGNDYYVGDAGKTAFAATAGRIPSSYRSQVLDGAVGTDLGADSSLETTFLHIDQADVELSGSPFDIRALASNAITSKLTLTDREYFDSASLVTYFNQTRLSADNFNSSKAIQMPTPFGIPVAFKSGAEQRSAGYRSSLSWGEPDWHQVTVGTDFRYTFSELNELDRYGVGSLQSYPIPQTNATNVGLFQETRLQLTDPWSIKLGGRVDWTHMNAARFVDDNNDTFNDPGAGIANPEVSRTNSYSLYSGFLTSRYDVTDELNLNASYGYAERSPTSQELYAQLPYVNIYQDPYSYVLGNRFLKEERLHQIDVGADVAFDRWRGGVHGFSSFIHNYIGTEINPYNLGTSFTYRNYDNARITGAELSSEFDATEVVTLFGNAAYVDGWNHSLKAPLPNIYPIQANLGIRLHDPRAARRWGAELSCRAVQNYNRVGAVDNSLVPGIAIPVTTSAPGFATGDLRTYYRMTNTASLTFGITNFTDRFYQDPLDARAVGNGGSGRGLYQMGRNFYFGADFKF
jgi:outer membrane receptor protein involved in Fe transport